MNFSGQSLPIDYDYMVQSCEESISPRLRFDINKLIVDVYNTCNEVAHDL